MKKLPLWLQGGLIAAFACIALFLFYILAGPILNEKGMSTDWALILMTLTGHAIFIYIGFTYPELAICGPSGQTCGHWTASEGCLAYNPTYDPTCTTLVSWIISILAPIILLAVYFGIGAAIGEVVSRVLNKRVNMGVKK